MKKYVYLTRRAVFSASHRLHSARLSTSENKKLFGKCNRANGHGHNYVLEVTLRGEIDSDSGIVMNLTDLKKTIEKAVLTKVDHVHLNKDVPAFRKLNPTTENVAVVIWNWLEGALPRGVLYEVRLHETENNVVVYRGGS